VCRAQLNWDIVCAAERTRLRLEFCKEIQSLWCCSRWCGGFRRSIKEAGGDQVSVLGVVGSLGSVLLGSWGGVGGSGLGRCSYRFRCLVRGGEILYSMEQVFCFWSLLHGSVEFAVKRLSTSTVFTGRSNYACHTGSVDHSPAANAGRCNQCMRCAYH
jgi:hypothetical protein